MKTYEITNYSIKKAYNFLTPEHTTLANIKVYLEDNRNSELTVSASHEFDYKGEHIISKVRSFKVKEDKKGRHITYNLANMCTPIKIYLD